MRVVLSDESVNKYGMRVLTSGIDLAEFRKNPIMLYDHDSYRRLPIGKWEDIQIKNGVLSAEPTFDLNDEFAASIASKWEQNMLNAASISFQIIETSEDPKLIKAGQRRATVTRSRLREASIVPFPGNGNAYKLHFEDQGIELSGDVPESVLDSLAPQIQLSEPKTAQKMDALKVKLGLAADANEQDIIAAIDKIEAVHQTQLSAVTGEMAEAVIGIGRERGIITDDNEATYKKLSATNPGSVLAVILEKVPAVEPETKRVLLSEKLGERKPGSEEAANDRATWSFDDWRKKDSKGLEQMQLNEPKKFDKLLEQVTA